MGRSPRVFAPGLVYHVVVRGNHREPTFLQHRDYLAYLARLRTYQDRFDAALRAYCLMPNHVHLLIQLGQIPLGALMQGVQQSYTQYFNRTYATVGHVFQGRYRAFVCADEGYLAALVRYIHLNPVRAGLVLRPDAYPYSSHGPYWRGRATRLVDPGPILSLIGGAPAYRHLLSASADPSAGANDLPPSPAGPQPTHLAASRPLTATGACPRPPRKPVEAAIDRLAQQLGCHPASVRSRERGWRVSRARALIAFTLVRRLRYRVASVAAAFGRGPASTGVLISRLGHRMDSEPALSREVTRLTECLDC